MNIRYPIYEGVYRILTHFPKQEAAGGPFCLSAKVNHRNHTDKNNRRTVRNSR